MPVFDRLVGSLIGDKVTYVRKGLYCDDCLPVSPCLGHWTVDGEALTQAEFDVRTKAMGERLERGLATMDWERVMGGAEIYAHIRGGWREKVNGGDVFLAMTEPTTMTDSEPHFKRMKRLWPELLKEEETVDG